MCWYAGLGRLVEAVGVREVCSCQTPPAHGVGRRYRRLGAGWDLVGYCGNV